MISDSEKASNAETVKGYKNSYKRHRSSAATSGATTVKTALTQRKSQKIESQRLIGHTFSNSNNVRKKILKLRVKEIMKECIKFEIN
jgi:hypothetical protein